MGVFVSSLKYGILRILRYNFDCGNHILCTLLAFMEFWFFIYNSITKRLEDEVTLFEITIRPL